MATDTSVRDQQARAHAGLGRAYQALGNLDSARDHYEQALAIYGELEMPEAGEVRARLADIAGGQPEAPPVNCQEAR